MGIWSNDKVHKKKIFVDPPGCKSSFSSMWMRLPTFQSSTTPSGWLSFSKVLSAVGETLSINVPNKIFVHIPSPSTCYGWELIEIYYSWYLQILVGLLVFRLKWKIVLFY